MALNLTIMETDPALTLTNPKTDQDPDPDR